jgi:NADPH-dependent F420 reductase
MPRVSSTPRIGLLGGTGIEGKGLALRFAQAGVPVTIGSRSLERAQRISQELNSQVGDERITGAENREMLAWAEMVFLTTPFGQAADAINAYREALRPESVLADVTVPVKTKNTPGPGDLPEGSGCEFLAKQLPEGVPLVGVFKTIPSHVLADLQVPLECDVFVCGDSEEAKARVMEAVRLIPTVRPVDVGRLKVAGTLERMTALAIGINRKYKIKTARFRVVGL